MFGAYAIVVLALLGLGWSVDAKLKFFFTQWASAGATYTILHNEDLVEDFAFPDPNGYAISLIQEAPIVDANLGDRVTVRERDGSVVLSAIEFVLTSDRAIKCWNGMIIELPGVPGGHINAIASHGEGFPFGLEDLSRPLSFRQFAIGNRNFSGVYADYFVLSEARVFAFEKNLMDPSTKHAVPDNMLTCVDDQTQCQSTMCCSSHAAGNTHYGLVIHSYNSRLYEYYVVCIGSGPDGCSDGLYKSGLHRDVKTWSSMEVEIPDNVVTSLSEVTSMTMARSLHLKFYGVYVMGHSETGKPALLHQYLGEVSLLQGSAYNFGEAFGYVSGVSAILYPRIMGSRWMESNYYGDEHPTTVSLRCRAKDILTRQAWLYIEVFYLDGLHGETTGVSLGYWGAQGRERTMQDFRGNPSFTIELSFTRRIIRNTRIFFHLEGSSVLDVVSWDLPESGLSGNGTSGANSNSYFEVVGRTDGH